MHTEFPRQPPKDRLEMPLAHAMDQRLTQLRAVLEVEGRVFFVELVQPGCELVLFAALLHHHGRGRDRVGERNGRKTDGMVPLTEGVASVRIPELGYRADIAGSESFHFDPVSALLNREVIQLLRYLMLGVPHLGAVDQVAPV